MNDAQVALLAAVYALPHASANQIMSLADQFLAWLEDPQPQEPHDG